MYDRAESTAQQPQADNGNSRNSAERFTPSARIPVAAATAVSASTVPTTSGAKSGPGGGTAGREPAGVSPVRSTLLQPRVAVALGVSKTWYPLLFLCRLASIAPGVLFGLPSAIRLLATLHLMYLDQLLDGGALARLGRGDSFIAASGYDAAFEARLRLTETLLATIWVRFARFLLPQRPRSLTSQPFPPRSTVLCVSIPLLLLHRLPHVALAAALHPASHHCPPAHDQRNKRLPHFLGPPFNRRLRRPPSDPAGMDRHLYREYPLPPQ